MIQEPWTIRDLSTKQSVSHPHFTYFCPLSTWTAWPRVLTFVRKTKELHPYQESMDLSRDLLKIVISTNSGQKLRI